MATDPLTLACPVVTLTSSEVLLAASVGCMRRVSDLRAGRRDAHGQPNVTRDVAWQVDIEGACGEMAVAKYLGVYWSGAINNLAADDVGTVQVRTTGRDNGRLILHPTDPDDRPFVLVTGVAPRYSLRGWIYGWDGKRPEWWADPAGGRPAFFVPPKSLASMESFAASRR